MPGCSSKALAKVTRAIKSGKNSDRSHAVLVTRQLGTHHANNFVVGVHLAADAMCQGVAHLDLEERFRDSVHLFKLRSAKLGASDKLTVCGRPARRAMSEKVSRCDESARANGECVASTAVSVSAQVNVITRRGRRSVHSCDSVSGENSFVTVFVAMSWPGGQTVQKDTHGPPAAGSSWSVWASREVKRNALDAECVE